MTDLPSLRKRLDKLRSQHHHLCQRVEEEEQALSEAREKEASLLEARKIVQEVSSHVQEQAHKRIAALVTRCLATVFGEGAYEFKIFFEQKRGKTEARLCFVRDGEEVHPTQAAGGGVVDVASFALRLSCLLLEKPAKRKLLVLDEPFRFVSREYIGRVRSLLETLSEELDLQIVMVTHNRRLRVGKVVEIGGKKDGPSSAED